MEKNNRSTCTTSYGNITAQSDCLLWKYYRPIELPSMEILPTNRTAFYGNITDQSDCLLWKYYRPIGLPSMEILSSNRTAFYGNIIAQSELSLIGILLPNWNCPPMDYYRPISTASCIRILSV